jgi:hypothetical protein
LLKRFLSLAFRSSAPERNLQLGFTVVISMVSYYERRISVTAGLNKVLRKIFECRVNKTWNGGAAKFRR